MAPRTTPIPHSLLALLLGAACSSASPAGPSPVDAAATADAPAADAPAPDAPVDATADAPAADAPALDDVFDASTPSDVVTGQDAIDDAPGADVVSDAGVCSDGQTRCDASCATTADDPLNCGACGVACGMGERCESGRCAQVCPEGQTRCVDGCHDLQRDLAHCGSCGARCNERERCEGGVCVLTCPAGQSACDGACRDLSSDEAHCGACGARCADEQRCVMGRCALSCRPGDTVCDGRCTSLLSDPTNCAACGRRCPAPPNTDALCEIGRCDTRCATGFADCDRDAENGCEAELGTSAHCAACGDRCGPYPNGTAQCTAGACAFRCDEGFADCDGDRANGCEVALGASCTVGRGACARPGVMGCVGVAGGCVGTPGEPSTELCNDVDDDCDGAVDQGLSRGCYTGPTDTAGVGACRAGTQTCAAGAWSVSCAGEVRPVSEVCGNAVDDDCDGSTDEGCSGNGSSCQAAILVTGTSTFSRTTCSTAGSTIVDSSCNSGASPEHVYVVRLTRSATVVVHVTGFPIGTNEGDILYRGTTCPGSNVTCTQHNTDLRQNLPAGSHYFAIEDDHGQCQSYTVTFTIQ